MVQDSLQRHWCLATISAAIFISWLFLYFQLFLYMFQWTLEYPYTSPGTSAEVLHTCSNEAKPVHDAPGGSSAVFYSLLPCMVKCALGEQVLSGKSCPLNQITSLFPYSLVIDFLQTKNKTKKPSSQFNKLIN